MATVTAPHALAIPEKDLEALAETDRAAVLEYRARAEAVLVDARALAVTDGEGKTQAVEVLSGVARIKREAEAKRDGLVRPHNDHVKTVNSVFRLVLAPVLEADTLLRTKVRDFDRAEAQRAAEAAAAIEAGRVRAEALAKEAEKAEKAGETEAAGQLFDRAVEAEQTARTAPAVAPPSRITRTDVGAVSTRKRWTFEVTDKAKVPLKYLVVDDVAVRKEITGGVREIDGLRIFQDESLAVRG